MTKCHPTKHENLSEAVIRALAAEKDTSPEKLRPLYESIDPGALDTLFSSRDTDGAVEFEHAGYRIGVYSSGEIRLDEAD